MSLYYLYTLFFYIIKFFFFLMIRRPPRSTQGVSSAASDVYKRQVSTQSTWAYFGVFTSLTFLGYCGYFLWKIRTELDSQDMLNKYGSLYYNLRTTNWKCFYYYLFWFIGIRVLLISLIVFLEKSPNGQIYSFFAIHCFAVGYLIVIRPFKNILEFVNTLFGYLGIIIGSCLYMGLNNSNLNQAYVEDLGKWVMYTTIVTASLNILMCIISASWDFYNWFEKSYPDIDQPHKGIQRITQKEVSMEENPGSVVKELSELQSSDFNLSLIQI
eukprot:TRINITY_DN13871_c0_g2_i4.p1 TRINITY_DN13871_c0_g2~~TRINITY_DN13871_c0_g2_i4.p1  ORF type:complete len:270 (+),score=41.39 TRINITY_DN13871_c0_g2_i4:45-854(+)